MRFARLAACSPLLFCLGCGDDPPPPPQGAFSVTFIDDGPEGSEGCALKGHNTQVGKVTSTTKDHLLKTNEEGAEIECSVTGSGSFTIDGNIFQGAAYLSVTLSGLKSRANGGPTLEAPFGGTVAYSSPDTAAETYSTAETPCNFYFGEGTNQDVAAGRVWMTFNCPELVRDTSKCELGDSYVIFENCGGNEEEEE